LCVIKSEYRQVVFYPRVMFLKNVAQMKIVQIEHKIPIWNIVFPGDKGIYNLTLLLYDYTTSRLMDLYSICVL
jgi:hypothetical protein